MKGAEKQSHIPPVAAEHHYFSPVTGKKKKFSRFPTNHVYLSFINIKHTSLSTPDEDAVLTPLCSVVIQGVGLQSDQDI